MPERPQGWKPGIKQPWKSVLPHPICVRGHFAGPRDMLPASTVVPEFMPGAIPIGCARRAYAPRPTNLANAPDAPRATTALRAWHYGTATVLLPCGSRNSLRLLGLRGTQPAETQRLSSLPFRLSGLSERPCLTRFQGGSIMPSMSIDDNDFLAACAMAGLGSPPDLFAAARVVAAANDLNPATGRTKQ